MRILSWNINGIRTLPQYYPWNTFKSCQGILEELKADIICFQEMKSSRAALPRDVGLPGPFTSFFSFPVSKGGYSGVAVYADSRTMVPLKAEEGLSGKLPLKPALSTEERISSSYPSPHEIDLFADEDGDVPSSFDALDGEGRGLVVDFGLFVLINVYCPNETSDARLAFKMNYHLMLQERVRKLIEEEQREVIVLGDLNVCAAPIDHCDGHLPSNTAAFYEHPARVWFHKWLSPNGPLIDIVRDYHPRRKGLFTCWNMKLQARETNYGTRVDYILVTKGLLPWISHGDIQPSLKGSDHCPVYIDLRDEITLASGETVSLRDATKQHAGPKELPRLAAKFWEELSGKQTVLSAFFGKGTASRNNPVTSSTRTPTPPPASSQDTTALTSSVDLPSAKSATVLEASQAEAQALKKFKLAATRPIASSNSTASIHKRKPSDIPQPSSTSKKRKQSAKGQPSIAAFFSKPPTASSSTQEPPEIIEIDNDPPTSPASTHPLPQSQPDAATDQLDADYRLACALAAESSLPPFPSASSPSPSFGSQPTKDKHKDKAAWSTFFAPVQPPNCLVHNEPTRLYTVNKQGPNKGKTFYLCSRPVGPGYDKGRGERLRDEVDHQYRCNFFKWASEARKEAMRERERERTRSQN